MADLKRAGGGMPLPAAAERERIDAALARYPAQPRATLSLPILQDVQRALGWLAPETLAYVSERTRLPLAHLQGLASFYELLSTEPQGACVIHVCDDVACSLGGRSAALLAALHEHLGIGPGETTADGRFTVRTAPCLGGCDRAPCLVAGPDLTFAGPVDPAAVPALTTALAAAAPAATAPTAAAAPAAPTDAPTDAAALPPPAPLAHGTLPGTEPVLLARCGRVDPASLRDFTAAGGFRALRRALDLGPRAVIAAVKDAGLVGRGGAAFPCGVKWESCRAAHGAPKYVVLNADESEPGTFTNRKLLKEDPYALVEAMIIAAWAVGAQQGYAYIRGEYSLAAARFQHAVDRCRAAGYLGDDIMGSDLAFDIEVRRGAGAYVCGEETALFESIEGRRGEPRNKPPFPTVHGLFGKPTVINNVETLACVPHILLRGPEWFRQAGSPGGAGPKLFAVSGDVERPGVYEVPLGTTLRELIQSCAGGVRGSLQAVLLGGAAGTFLPPAALALRLDYASVRAAGASLGSGAVLVFNTERDLWQAARRIARFFATESCGKCVPCRVGTARQWELVDHLVAGGDPTPARALLDDLAAVMGDASICGLGQSAAWAVQSLLRHFGPPGK